MIRINNPSWNMRLSAEFEKPYFRDLENFVDSEYERHTCYPPKNQIFQAFERCSFDAVKVVIIGQDPYHGPNQAHGLCFSVNDGIKIPPSLKNIFKELFLDLGKEIPQSGNLQSWADQGVLLLNATLSVRHGEAGSHQKKGWESFTDSVIEIISEEKEHVVFLLWGNFAHKKGFKLNREKHLVLESCHPSPLSAIHGKWFGNRHFSRTNTYLIETGQQPVNW